MGASLPVASGVAKLPGRKSTRRCGDGQSSGCSCLPAGQDCASREFCPERAPAVPPAEGSIDPGPQRIHPGRARDARLDRQPLKPCGAGSDRLNHARVRGRRSRRTIGLRRDQSCAVLGGTAGRDEKHGRWPLWLLDVSHNLRPRCRQLDPSRTGRARRRRDLLERNPAAEAGKDLPLPRRRRRGAGTRDARRRQRFQRSHARPRIWRRLVRRQRRRGLFLEQSRSAALSPRRRPAAESDYASSSRRRCGCAAVRRWRRRPPPGTNGLRPGGSHWGRGGNHHAGRRRSLRRDGSPSSRLGERLLFDAAPQPRRKPHVLADLAPSRHAVGGDGSLGRGHPPRWDNRKHAPGRWRARRVGVPAGMVA